MTHNSFSQHLLGMDKRIEVIEKGYNDSLNYPLYNPTKEKIIIVWFEIFQFVEHEIAHIVEFSDLSRILLPNFGFKSVHKTNNSAVFFRSMAKEIKVRAIQMHLLKKDRVRHPIWESILNHKQWVDNAQRLIPFGRFKNYQDMEAWENHLRTKTYNAWGLDRIENEWRNRLNYLRDWMETQ